MADVATVADVMTLTIKAALAPMQAQLATLTEKCAQLASLAADVPALRERLAVAEARPAVPGPPGPAGLTPELTVSQDADDPRVLTFGTKGGGPWGTVRLTTPRYCGPYKAAESYALGDQVTHSGSLWTCTADKPARPGTNESGWKLTVKNGDVG